MSGSNGAPRFARTNREDELVPLKSRGTEYKAFQYSKISTTTIVPGSNPPVSTNPNPTVLTPAQMFQNLSFDAGTTNLPITAPSLINAIGYLISTNGLLEAGYSWTVSYKNESPHTSSGAYGVPSTAVTISFPADWSISGAVINTLSIFQGETVDVTYTIDSVGPPVVIRASTGPPQATGGRNPYSFDKPVLVRPSNADTSMRPFSVMYDYSLGDGQGVSYIISTATPMKNGNAFDNGLLNLQALSATAQANAQNYYILCTNGSLAPNTYNFRVRLDGQAFGTAFNVVSAAEFKTDIVALPSTLADGYAILPHQYRYLWEAVGTKHYGFIADEIADLASMQPIVSFDQDNNPVSLDAAAVTAVHQQLIRDLNSRVTALEASLTLLKTELAAAPNNLTIT